MTITQSACDEAGECRHDAACPFYAENCRLDEPAPGGPQK